MKDIEPNIGIVCGHAITTAAGGRLAFRRPDSTEWELADRVILAGTRLRIFLQGRMVVDTPVIP